MDRAALPLQWLHTKGYTVSRSLKIDCFSCLLLHGPLWISALKLLHVR